MGDDERKGHVYTAEELGRVVALPRDAFPRIYADALNAAAPRMEELLREMDEDAVCFNREREPCGECLPCRVSALLDDLDKAKAASK